MKIRQGNEALALSTMGRINVIYGYTGAGKSSLALTTTKNKKVLYVDIENGVGKVWDAITEDQKSLQNLNTASVDNIAELIEFINSEEVKGYDMLVIDSITFLAEQELGNKTDAGKKLSFHDYGDLGQNVKQMLRRAQMRGINILFLMQATQIEGDSGNLIYFPRSAGQQITPAVLERADNILYIQERDGKRSMHTTKTREWHAKKRDPLPDTFAEEHLNWESIESFFAKHEPQKADKEDLKKLIKEAGVKDPKKLFDFIGWKKEDTLYQHQLEEAKTLLAKQIEANKLQKNENIKNSK